MLSMVMSPMLIVNNPCMARGSVKTSEIQKVREKLGLDRHQFGRFLGLTYESLMNIENGVRNPSPLAIKLVRYLDDLPKAKAISFIEECNRHEPK